MQHLSTTLFALQQCLDFTPCGLSSLSALQQGYAQSVHPYCTLLPTCVCPFPLAWAPTGELAQALGDGETDVTLWCCMCGGVRFCAEARLFLSACAHGNSCRLVGTCCPSPPILTGPTGGGHGGVEADSDAALRGLRLAGSASAEGGVSHHCTPWRCWEVKKISCMPS